MSPLRLQLFILLQLLSLEARGADPAPTPIPVVRYPVDSSARMYREVLPPSVTPAPLEAIGAPDDEVDPAHADLQVLLIMDWRYPGAEAELRKLEEIGDAFEKLRDQGWSVGIKESDQLRIVSRDQVAELVAKLELSRFPAVVAMHAGEVIRSFRSGCTTPLDEHTFAWMRTGVSQRPVGAPLSAPQVAWSGSYPLRGAHWSVDGNYSPSFEQLLRHLRGRNHAHLIPGDWSIESWSYEELRSLHDDLHERNRPRELVRTWTATQPMRIESLPSGRTHVRGTTPVLLIP